ncbi:hypothetical protein N0V90_002087 [Kalmusia sp. IMI 367209]|nr:hypothetical protein N0V90_002087 [Kalmusia sp. IMI 367209]
MVHLSDGPRLDLQHQMWLLTFQGRLHTTPLSPTLSSILDVGTGTGVWARSMARAFPKAEITATDLVLPPVRDDATPNLRFLRHNAEDSEWTPFPLDHFDFIHARMVTSGIHDWPEFRAKCYRHIKPGGVLQLLDLSHPLRAETSEFDSIEASPLIAFVQLAGDSWRQDGLDYRVTGKQIEGLKQVGFGHVEEETFRWPIGGWPEDDNEKRIGEMARENVTRFLSLAGKSILTNKGFMTEEKAEEAIQAAKEDLARTDEKKFYYVMKVHTARKPE